MEPEYLEPAAFEGCNFSWAEMLLRGLNFSPWLLTKSVLCDMGNLVLAALT